MSAEELCKWYRDSEEYWQSECGVSWIFLNEYTPFQNGMRFCLKCGKPMYKAALRNPGQRGPLVEGVASTNSVMDAIAALVDRWKNTVPKIQYVWGVNAFMEWAQQQHQ